MQGPRPTIRRGNERQALRVAVSVRRYGAGKPSKALMFDLSATGCCIVWRGTLPLGTQLLIRIPGHEFRPATVAWCREEAAGLEFHKPLHPEVVERYAQSHPSL